MAIKETKNEPKDLVEPVPEELEKVEPVLTREEAIGVAEPQQSRGRRPRRDPREETRAAVASWVPKSKLGKLIKEGKEKDIDKILQNDKKILESEIVDSLLVLETDLILIGQAKGKFGGGKRRAWRQTQKKTKEGNVL